MNSPFGISVAVAPYEAKSVPALRPSRSAETSIALEKCAVFVQNFRQRRDPAFERLDTDGGLHKRSATGGPIVHQDQISAAAHDPETGDAAADLPLLERQESTLIVLNLLVLAALALIHIGFVSVIGQPSRSLLALVSIRFLTQLAELAWILSSRYRPSAAALARYSTLSVWVNVAFAGLVSMVVSHEDSHYSVLMVIPIVSAAFRFSLSGALSVVGAASALTFLQVWSYFRLHPPPEPTEYFEAATTSVMLLVVSVIAWVLGKYLREDRRRLAKSLDELAHARDRLVAQEKLAAVGRLASAIAHEIRNPVAMISSSLELARADATGLDTRDEMYRIATEEAARLEQLTSDFLAYARARPPARRRTEISPVTDYVLSLARAKAAERSVTLVSVSPGMLEADVDAFQMQQAILNLTLNAIDACGPGGTVRIGAESEADQSVCLFVENDGPAIPPDVLEHVFEPFFTTKPHGTGLGLAIARSIARAHGGELELAANEPGRIRFDLLVPPAATGLVTE